MRIALDGREFIDGKSTGIARVLSGLLDVLTQDNAFEEVILAVQNPASVPECLTENSKIYLKQLPRSFLMSEKALSDMTKCGIHCFISPYPKLPLFGTHCQSIHTVHDVLDLTHPAYRKRLKVNFDKLRLKNALIAADLTWYVSLSSLQETEKLVGFSGCNPKVRHLGLEKKFTPKYGINDDAVLGIYELHRGYILIIGNGMPHKNLGILLEVSSHIKRKFVFVGVSKKKQTFWRLLHPEANTIWLDYVKDEDLPTILRNSFCLAQPSTAEGYGYPPLEAMACGIPVVISDIQVLLETTGGAALSADPYVRDEWIEAFENLEDKAFYKAQVEKGLKWVNPFIGPNGWAGHVADLKELIEGR